MFIFMTANTRPFHVSICGCNLEITVIIYWDVMTNIVRDYRHAQDDLALAKQDKKVTRDRTKVRELLDCDFAAKRPLQFDQ